MFRDSPFPFEGGEFPRELGAVVQRTVLTGEMPALVVIHDAGNSWLVGDGVNDPNDDASVATHMHHAIRLNSSIASLASMPLGAIATREGPKRPWRVEPFTWDEDQAK